MQTSTATIATFPAARTKSYLAAEQGDVFDFTGQRMDVECVLGFRPGIDRLVLPQGRLGFREDGADVVITHASGEIILQGVSIDELANGRAAA